MKPELLFDGNCGLCRRSASILAAIDWLHRIDRRTIQDPTVADRAARLGLSAEDLRREIHLIFPDGTLRRGFFAIRRIAWLTPVLLPFAPFLYLPGMSVLGPHLYRLIARNRR